MITSFFIYTKILYASNYMAWISEYLTFLLQVLTVFIFFTVFIAFVINSRKASSNNEEQDELKIKSLNDQYKTYKKKLQVTLLDKKELKLIEKEQKKAKKSIKNSQEQQKKKRIFVLDFTGDIQANAVNSFRDEITSILLIASENDEVLIRLNSPGGVVNGYGLASAQIQRLRNSNLRVTVCVDKIAASGGYMMACVAHSIVAAPFAIVGSIGVVAQLPNFHRLLKKNDIDFETFTAGENKRTVTIFGNNTDQGKEKFQDMLNDTHMLFKEYINQYRPEINIDDVANGDYWYGQQALNKGLIDDIMTSDEYILKAVQNETKVYKIEIIKKKKKKILDFLMGSIYKKLFSSIM